MRLGIEAAPLTMIVTLAEGTRSREASAEWRQLYYRPYYDDGKLSHAPLRSDPCVRMHSRIEGPVKGR